VGSWSASKAIAVTGAASAAAAVAALALVDLGNLGWRLVLTLGVALPTGVAGALGVWAAARRRIRQELIGPIAIGTLLVVYIGVVAALDPDDPVSSVLGLAWQFPLWVGGMLIGTGFARRVGDERLCARCEYPFIDDPGAPRCPECGSDWRSPHAVVTGRRRVNRLQLCVGAAMLLLVVPMLLLGQSLASLVQRCLPTSYLIHQAVHRRGGDDEAWAALRARALAPEQVRTLASGLLDSRLNGEWHWSRDDELWIDAQVAAGTLPPDLVERYFGEMVETARARLAPVEETLAGVTLELTAPVRINIQNTQVALVVVEGWWVDGTYVTTPESGTVMSAHVFQSSRSLTGSINPVRLRVERTDKPVTVKFVGWAEIGPFPTMSWQAAWSSAPGTPGATPSVPGATSRVRRFEVEAVVAPIK
jgi:hypothetical protein